MQEYVTTVSNENGNAIATKRTPVGKWQEIGYWLDDIGAIEPGYVITTTVAEAVEVEVDPFTQKPTDQLTYDQLYAAWRGDRITTAAYQAGLDRLGLTGDRLEDLTRSR